MAADGARPLAVMEARMAVSGAGGSAGVDDCERIFDGRARFGSM